MIYKLTGARRDRAVALYVGGKTCREVAAETGETYGCIRATLDDAGVLRNRGTPRLPQERLDSAVRMYRDGTTVDVILRQLHMSQKCLMKAVDAAGVPRRRPYRSNP